jgi:hypothetical protein
LGAVDFRAVLRRRDEDVPRDDVRGRSDAHSFGAARNLLVRLLRLTFSELSN